MARILPYFTKIFRLICRCVHVHLWSEFFSAEPRFVQRTHFRAVKIFLDDREEGPRRPRFEGMKHCRTCLICDTLQYRKIMLQETLLNDECRGLYFRRLKS